MQRTKYNKPDAILTADWHLRETQPVCRTDDFWQVQWQKVDFIAELQQQYDDCPVLHAGDLFDHWKPSPYLLSNTIEHLPKQFWTVYGNHDLPQHNLGLAEKCGIYTLAQAEKLNIIKQDACFPIIYNRWGNNADEDTSTYLFGCSWEQILKSIKKHKPLITYMLIWHIMTYKKELPYPGCSVSSALSLLKKYPEYDLIVTGDNHKSFTEQYEGRLLVNPGSLMRQTADQADHQPCVYLWYANTNTVEPVYLPIKQDVVSRQHIEQREQHNQRLEAFITQLNSKWEASVSFEENLKQIEHEVPEPVMDIIHKALDDERI